MDLESFTHRTGRTGRMGKQGKSLTFTVRNKAHILQQIIEKIGVDPIWLNRHLKAVDDRNSDSTDRESGPKRKNSKRSPSKRSKDTNKKLDGKNSHEGRSKNKSNSKIVTTVDGMIKETKPSHLPSYRLSNLLKLSRKQYQNTAKNFGTSYSSSSTYQ